MARGTIIVSIVVFLIILIVITILIVEQDRKQKGMYAPFDRSGPTGTANIFCIERFECGTFCQQGLEPPIAIEIPGCIQELRGPTGSSGGETGTFPLPVTSHDFGTFVTSFWNGIGAPS